MVNRAEAAKIAAFVAISKSREVMPLEESVWAEAFQEVPYEVLLRATKRALRQSTFFDFAAVEAQLSWARSGIQKEVRGAITRALIREDWPLDQPLPPPVLERLKARWASEQGEYNDRPEELAPPVGRPAIQARVQQALPTLKTVDNT